MAFIYTYLENFIFALLKFQSVMNKIMYTAFVSFSYKVKSKSNKMLTLLEENLKLYLLNIYETI